MRLVPRKFGVPILSGKLKILWFLLAVSIFWFVRFSLIAEKTYSPHKETITFVTPIKYEGFEKMHLSRQFRDLSKYSGDLFKIRWIISINHNYFLEEEGVVFQQLLRLQPQEGCVYFNIPKLFTRNDDCQIFIILISTPIQISNFSEGEFASFKGYKEKMMAVESIEDNSWVSFLDSDNTVSCDYFTEAHALITSSKRIRCIIFSQQRVNYTLHAFDPFTFTKVDTAMILIHKTKMKFSDWPNINTGGGDHQFISKTVNRLVNVDGSVVLSGRRATFHNRLTWDLSNCYFCNPIEYSSLYVDYGVSTERNVWIRFCAETENQDEFCNFSVFELELYYLRLRHLKPDKVLEINTNIGLSTLVILQALSNNGYGSLISVGQKISSKLSRYLTVDQWNRLTIIKVESEEFVLPDEVLDHYFDYVHYQGGDCRTVNIKCDRSILFQNLFRDIKSRRDTLHVSVHGVFDCRIDMDILNREWLWSGPVGKEADKLTDTGEAVIEWVNKNRGLYLDNIQTYCPLDPFLFSNLLNITLQYRANYSFASPELELSPKNDNTFSSLFIEIAMLKDI